jgi:AraC-like DNA-binding protein
MRGEELQNAFFRQLGRPEALTSLFEYLPRVHLFVKDRRHRFMKMNRANLQLHGLEEECEVLGKTDFDLHPPTLAAQYVEEDRRVMDSGKPLPDQVWLVTRADGFPGWYLSTKLPLFDARHRVFGIAGVMRPYDEGGDAPPEYERLTPAIQWVLKAYPERLTVADMARKAHLSVSHLQREFQRLFGMTPSDYLLRVRLLMARRRLEQNREAVGVIALACGFYDQSHFTRSFLASTGMRPLEYRRRFSSEARLGNGGRESGEAL